MTGTTTRFDQEGKDDMAVAFLGGNP